MPRLVAVDLTTSDYEALKRDPKLSINDVASGEAVLHKPASANLLLFLSHAVLGLPGAISNRRLIGTDEYWEGKGWFPTFLTLNFLTPLLQKGAQSTLHFEDMGTVGPEDMSTACFAEFDKAWADELARVDGKPSLMRAQLRMIGYHRFATAIWYSNMTRDHKHTHAHFHRGCTCVFSRYYFLAQMLQFVPVAILNILVQHFSGTGFRTLSYGLLVFIATLLLIVPIMSSVCLTRHDVLM